MAKRNKITGKRIEFWTNKKGEINYRCIGKNGKLLSTIVQGFKRRAGMTKNILAMQDFFSNMFAVPFVKIDKP